MKKNIIFLILTLVIIFTFSSVSFAKNNIVETPTIKTFVIGRQVKFESVPVTINGEILLNANELLVKLGVPNDNKHIILDKDKKNLVINYGKISMKMATNSNKATVSKYSKVLNSSPIIYKNKLYIPVKSTVELLGMKFAWDGIEKSVYIQNENEYNKVKAIFDKAISTTQGIDKYIVEYSHNSKSNYKDKPSYDKHVCLSTVDKKKMLMHITSDSEDSYSGHDTGEHYLLNNLRYTKYSFNEKWEKEILSKKDYAEWINQYDVSKFVISDILYCGLNIEDVPKDNTIKLKGNVYLFVKGQNNQQKVEPVDTYTEIIINKSTNIICRITIKYNEYDDSSYFGKYLYSSTESYSYRDFNGDFNVELPDESKMELEQKNDTNVPTITLSEDEETKIEALSSSIDKIAVDGAWKHPYKLETTQAIMFIVIKNKNDFSTFTNLSDDAKKVFINQIVQDNYGDYVGCETVFGMVTYDSKAYASISTGYETAPQNVKLEKYEEGIDVTIVVQDKKNNTYQNYEGK